VQTLHRVLPEIVENAEKQAASIKVLRLLLCPAVQRLRVCWCRHCSYCTHCTLTNMLHVHVLKYHALHTAHMIPHLLSSRLAQYSGPCTTPLPLHCHSTATPLPLHCHSTPTPLPTALATRETTDQLVLAICVATLAGWP
jgi:hypothetical protein